MSKKTGLALAVLASGMLACVPAAAEAGNEGMALFVGDAPELFARCGGFLEGVVVDPAGGVWVLELFGDQILSVSEQGECTRVAGTGGMPNGAKWHDDGSILITDQTGLLRFDPETGTVATVADSYGGESLTGLNDLSIDAAGGVYFTAPWGSSVLSPTGRLFYLPEGASEPQLVAEGLAFPNGVAVHPHDPVVLVAEFAGKRILSLPQAGSDATTALPHVFAHTRGGVGTDGMVFGADGTLYAANLGTGEVLVFAPDGRMLGAVSLPEGAGHSVTNLAIGDGYLYITEAEKGEIYRIAFAP